MPIMVSTVFAKSAVLPAESASLAVKSIENEITNMRFQEFKAISVEDKKEESFENDLTTAILEAQNYIYEKHYKQQKFAKQRLEKGKTVSYYDLDMASRDEKEQPYVVIYNHEAGKQAQLFSALGCGSNGKSFDPNKGTLNKRLIIKDEKTYPLLTQKRLTNIIAKVLPEQDCEYEDDVAAGSYKKYSGYDIPISIYDAEKNQYITAIGEYQGYNLGYNITKLVPEECTISDNEETGPSLEIDKYAEIDFDDHHDFVDEEIHDWEKEIKTSSKSSAGNSKTLQPLLTDLFLSTEKKENATAPIPQKFLCELTHKIMEDPVRVLGGMRSRFPLVYERSHLEEHFDNQGFDETVFQQIMPDLALKREINDYLKSRSENVDILAAHKIR